MVTIRETGSNYFSKVISDFSSDQKKKSYGSNYCRNSFFLGSTSAPPRLHLGFFSKHVKNCSGGRLSAGNRWNRVELLFKSDIKIFVRPKKKKVRAKFRTIFIFRKYLSFFLLFSRIPPKNENRPKFDSNFFFFWSDENFEITFE